MDDRKKKNLIWKVEAVLFWCGAAGFWRDLCSDPRRGADPTSGQCTVS